MERAPRVFVSYSHRDRPWKERVVKHLKVLAGEGLAVWDDRRIAAGADWQAEIARAIADCDVALLLVSADFLISPFILGQEVPPLLQRRAAQGVRLVPLILSPCAWTRVPWLCAIQARPQDGKPLSGLSRHAAEAALAALAGEIADLRGPGPDSGPETVPGPRDAERPGMGPRAAPEDAGVAPGDGRGREAEAPAHIDLAHLPAGAPRFFGRGPELAALEAAWLPGSGIAVVELIAPGGTGKTALVKRWLDGLKARDWDGAARVYAWSFDSQGSGLGSGDGRQASEDHFLAAALDWLAVEIAPSANPADKGQALAEALTRTPTLLVLDGCEPLQYPPGPLAGELRAPGLKALLAHLASAGRPGLCVLTTRERVRNLDEWVRGGAHPGGPVLRLDLGDLSDIDGARLLHALGAVRAGAAAIAADDPELRAASREVGGHALALSLLGNYLRLAHGGDIRRRDRADLGAARAATGGHAFRVMAAFVRWLGQGGESGARALAALRLLGFFDRPASPEDLAALRAAPPIPGLTEALFAPPGADATHEGGAGGPPAGSRRSGPDPIGEPIGDTQWRIALERLEDAGLIAPPAADGSLDAHPLVREYLASTIETDSPDVWRDGHRRLYARLKDSAPYRPDGLDGLEPLYRAVAHGCRAGLWQEVCDEVYIDRILRGTGPGDNYSTSRLGAIGADLGAVACFFAEPWSRPAPALEEAWRAWLLNEASTRLRALGRLGEALEPMRAGAQMAVQLADWKNAARGYGNLSELLLTLGRVAEATAEGERSVEHAERSGDGAWRMSMRATLADALHQRGETAAARAGFAEAESMQARFQPDYPLLYSLRGFRYCDLLLAGAERAAWDAAGGGAPAGTAEECAQAARRARQTLEWAEQNRSALLDCALDRLTLARCALYADRLAGRPPGGEAQTEVQRALEGLRAAARQDHIPRGLLARAWLRHAQGDGAGAAADLAEAQRIATRGDMRLYLADCALYRARLFRDRAALAQARALIETCGYGRRLPELADAERAAAGW